MATNTTQIAISINGKEVEHTLKGMGKEIGNLKKELRDLNASDPNFKTKQAEIKKQLSATTDEYNRLKTEIYGTNNATDRFVKSIDNSSKATSNFSSGLAGVGAGIAAAFTIDKLIQFGEVIYDQVERVRELKTELSALSGLEGSQLSNATVGTIGLANTYKAESKEVMMAANAMSKQLKISYAEALDEIKRGFQEGANASGDMLNQIKEYAPFIKEIGGETKDLVNIIKAGTVEGVFNDKAIDAVKEFSLRFREMTSATRDGITNLGLDVDQMQDKIAKGQMTYMDAMMQVSKEMSKLGNNSTVTGQVLADVFGGPGEDAGFEFISNLHKMNDGVTRLTTAQRDYNRVKEIELEANEKSALLFESLTGEGSKLNETLAEGKLLLIDITSALFDIQALRPSDDIMKERTQLTMLKNELLNVNTTQEQRKNIINEISTLYPEIFKNLDLETAKNDDLAKAIDGVSESLAKRYSIQKAQEKIDDAQLEVDKNTSRRDQLEAEIKDLIAFVQNNDEYKITLPADFNKMDVLEQAKAVQKQLTNGFWESYFRTSDKSKLTALISDLSFANGYLEEAKGNLEDISRVQNRIINDSSKYKPIQDFGQAISHSMPNSLGNVPSTNQPQSNADAGRADELKRQAQEAAAARKRAQAEREREAKRFRDQQLREAKQLHDQLIKERDNYEKKNKELSNKYDQEQIDAMKDGIQKELDQVHHNSVVRIEALNDEIKELEKLQKDYRNKADKLMSIGTEQAKKDAVEFRKLADEQVNIINWKNSSIIAVQEKATAEELKVYSKYRALEVQYRQKANDDLINSLKVQYNEELAEITNLEEAKQVLQEQYGVENVNQFASLNDARNQVLKEQNKKLLQEQLGALEIELQEIQNLINSDDLARESGLQVLTDEDRDKQIENLKQVGLAISEVKVAISGEKALTDDEKAARSENVRKELRSGLDILGFSADDWATALDGLETALPGLEKLGAALKLTEMALQSVSNAWGMMIQAQNAALDRQVKKYEASADKKSIALKKQLDEGYISQETYNAQIEALEEDLAARKSEIAYKQAMNDWRFQLMNGLANTALGVTKALASTPPPGNFALAALVGGLGAVQTGVIMANKPNRAFYNVGGPTTSLGYTDETGHEVAGVVHANEYVVPEWMHQIPVVANMVEFMEAIRTGGGAVASNVKSSYAEGGAVTPTENKSAVNDLSIVSSVIDQFNQNLQLNNQLLEHLISNGVELQMDMKAAQRLNHQLDKTKKYISQAKKS